MKPVDVKRASSAVILGLPHGGTYVPNGIYSRLNENGRKLADTDWHIDKLYDGVLEQATTVRANFHRYVIDANRDPADVSLYPNQNTTMLCPTTDFNGQPIWRDGEEPTSDEIAARRRDFHTPYHDAMTAEIKRVRDAHGACIVFDCHSIRSRIPFLFEGTLPVFSIGSYDGKSCSWLVTAVVRDICARPNVNEDFVVNGRFKGGWTTRYYGRPDLGIHAIQLELAQRSYLSKEEEPWEYDQERVLRLRATLAEILADLDQLARSGALS